MQSEKLWTKNFILVCVGIFFIFSNFYILLSTMPLALRETMNADATMASWVVSIYTLGVVLVRPFTGLLADKFGKKKVAVITFLLFSICSLSYFGIKSMGPLLLMRFSHGLFHSISTTAHGALAVDLSPLAQKGQGIAYYGLAMCLAMVVAPALGIYVLEHYNYQVLLAIASGMALMGFLVTLFVDKKETTMVPAKEAFSVSSFIELKVIPVGIPSFLIAFCYSAIIAFIAVYLTDLQLKNAAIYFYIAFALSMIVSRPTIGKLIDQKGAASLIYPSFLLFSLGMIVLGLAQSMTVVLGSGIILGLSYGAIFPCLQTIAVKASPAHRTGSAIATFFMFYDFGFGIGALVLAYIITGMGYSAMYFVVSGIVLLALLTYYLTHRQKGNVLNEQQV